MGGDLSEVSYHQSIFLALDSGRISHSPSSGFSRLTLLLGHEDKMSAMRCLHCGVERALLKKLAWSGNFCSEAHRLAYQEEFSRLALDRLLQSQPAAQKKSSSGAARPVAQLKVTASPCMAAVEEMPGDPDPASFLDELRSARISKPIPISNEAPIFRNMQWVLPPSIPVIVDDRNSWGSKISAATAPPSPVQVAMTQEPPPALPYVLQESSPWIEARSHEKAAAPKKAEISGIRGPGPVPPIVPRQSPAATSAKSPAIARPGPVGRTLGEIEPAMAMGSSGFKMVSEIEPEPGFLKLVPMWIKSLALAALLGGGAFLYVKFAG